MSRKPYMNGSYQEMMKRTPTRSTNAPHSEGKKPYMNGNYNEMEEFYFGQLSPWKFDMGNINFSSDFDFGDMGEGVIVSEGDCDTAWQECQEKLPSSCIGCGLPQMAEDCMNEKGFHMTGAGSNPNNLPECKEHKDILSCLHYNSLCYCLKCGEMSSPITMPCNSQMDEKCQKMVCEESNPCPSFTLEGSDSAPAYLCPTTTICAKSIEGGNPIGDCIYVPDEGCGTKTITVTDICGNIVTKKVRMTAGAWYQVEYTMYCPQLVNTNTCEFVIGGNAYAITQYTVGCQQPPFNDSCNNCPPFRCPNYPCGCILPEECRACKKEEYIYEWRC